MLEEKISTITVQELKQRMDKDPDLCLIDVRELHEWSTLRIPGAKLIPKDQITTASEHLPSDRSQAIYLHCKGGTRSLFAAYSLAEMGYHKLFSVNGGIMEWATQGYPVEQ